jgi:hypothetical protein
MWNAFGNYMRESFLEPVTSLEPKTTMIMFQDNNKNLIPDNRYAVDNEMKLRVPANTAFVCFRNCDHMIFRIRGKSASTDFKATFIVDSLYDHTYRGKAYKRFKMHSPSGSIRAAQDCGSIRCELPAADFPLSISTNDMYYVELVGYLGKPRVPVSSLPMIRFFSASDEPLTEEQEWGVPIPAGTKFIGLRSFANVDVLVKGSYMNPMCKTDANGIVSYTERNTNGSCASGVPTDQAMFKLRGSEFGTIDLRSPFMSGNLIFVAGELV